MNEEAFIKLIEMSQGNRGELKSIFDDCWAEYMEYLAGIAADIYDSCIEDYYNKYSPQVYDRHGYPEGKNLYQANQISFNEDDIDINVDAYSLWEYRGKEKRQRILDTVMQGLRGAGSRYNSFRGWPRSWRTSYPNQYSNSMYDGAWSSGYTTIEDIFHDFLATAIDSTLDYFNELFFNSI